MIASDWQNCKLLKPGMAWGDASKMNKWVVLELDAALSHLGRPFHIDCGCQGSHVANSEHAPGDAVDVCFPGASRLDLLDIFLEVSRFKFTGIGVYPDWKMPGLHVDFRKAPYRALWLGATCGAKQEYKALTRNEMLSRGMLE